jgi:hypothetical protein
MTDQKGTPLPDGSTLPACCNECPHMKLARDSDGQARFWVCTAGDEAPLVPLATSMNPPPAWCPLRGVP